MAETKTLRAQPQSAPTTIGEWAVTAIVLADEDEANVVGSIAFKLKGHGVLITVSYDDPSTEPFTLWTQMRDGADIELEFCGSNGNVSVNAQGEAITFLVMKCGAGGDGEINVRVPRALCATALGVVVDRIAEIHGTPMGVADETGA